MAPSQDVDRTQEPERNGLNVHQRDMENEAPTRRSWLTIFSPSAVAKLPKAAWNLPDRSTRTDHIPESGREGFNGNNQNRDYNAINQVRVPKKIATPIRVEGKVWFANERTWLSYVNISLLLGTLALALFNASKDQVARNFAFVYALISVGVLVYGWAVYQKRITMIRKRDPGHFDEIIGPVVISALLFFAILANFVIRVQELRRKGVPVPPNDN